VTQPRDLFFALALLSVSSYTAMMQSEKSASKKKDSHILYVFININEGSY
jgi:hypothetical protein